jgi:hypothetical protein
MADKAKVYIASSDYKADYKVYFVNERYKEANTALISPGELVKSDYQANVKVFITDHEYQAQIKIMREHFRSRLTPLWEAWIQQRFPTPTETSESK